MEPLGQSGLFTRAVAIRAGSEGIELAWVVPTGDPSGSSGRVDVAGDGALSVAWPLSEEAKARLASKGTSLVVWSNARALYRSKETFVRALVDLREAMGPAPILWAPRIATPCNVAILHYMGIDVLDTVEGLFLAAEGLWLYPELDIEPSSTGPTGRTRSKGTCRCRACKDGTEGIQARGEHANWQYEEEEARVRFMLDQGRLRELVESRTVGRPELGEMLRYFDTTGYAHQERHAPMVSDQVRPYGVEAAYHRPEMERYRRNFVERYEPPSTKEVLLVVPCSYTKPYSNSPTHRAIARAIGEAPGTAAIHTVSLTSPLGVVPRELEHFYPARNYDIPVTGLWTEEERTWVLEGLAHILSRGHYKRTLFHLPEDEYGWLKEIYRPSPSCLWTSGDRSVTSRESLAALEAEARSLPRATGGADRIRLDEARSSFSFQFSKPVTEGLYNRQVRLRGPPWFVALVDADKSVLATWKEDRGLWRLTTTGASIVLGAAKDWWVMIDDGVTLHGDLFAPGAISGGREVRVGGNALLVRDGRLVGVGEAVVPGSWMGRLGKGLVVKLRSRVEEQGRPEALETKKDPVTGPIGRARASDI